jgi:hypothetical protein
MATDKDKLLYRIFREDAEEMVINMNEFYRKRRKGLYPFLTPEKRVVWLKRDRFKIAAAKKISETPTSTIKRKSHKRHSHKDDIDIDLSNILPSGSLKYFILGIGAVVILYLVIKLIELIILG